MNQDTHSGLRILSRNAKEADIRAFLAGTKRLTEPSDRNMCEALRDIMKEEINEVLAEGRQKGMEHAILSSIKNLMDTMKLTAEQAMEALRVPLADRDKYASRL